MAKTFKEKRQAKQKAKFIGRNEHLDLFKNNLGSDDPTLIFNIYGQGGVGKTHLSKQYKATAEEYKCLTAYTDESIKSILQWMESVSKQFKEKNADLSEFDKRYKIYLQETKKLETDPDKPKGTLKTLVRTATKGALKEGKKWVPGGELIGSFLDEDGIATATSEWLDFTYKKISNKDEVELVLEPIKVLTPLFLKGINKYADDYAFICFFIDTFEETSKILEQWLLELLQDDKHGDLPGNILLVIAGREELPPNHWSELDDLIQKIPLEPFTPEEAEDYFIAHGITDEAVKADIVELSNRIPVWMAWLVNTARNNPANLNDPCEGAVERFLQWEKDDTKRRLALTAAIPRKLNQDVLECFLEDKNQCRPYFDWLCTQPFMQRRGDYWAYHNIVRDQMLRYLRTRSPKDWTQRHLALRDYYLSLQEGLGIEENERFTHATWLAHEQEYLYHALCAQPDQSIPEVMRAFARNLYERTFASSLIFGELLEAAGKDHAHEISKGWGLRINISLKEEAEEKYDTILQFIEDLLAKNWIIEAEHLANLWFWNGYYADELKKYDLAIEAYQQAIAIKPDKHEAFNNMGIAYDDKGEYDQAIVAYQKAVAIKPDYHKAFYNMGSAYHHKGEYDLAIEAYQQAIAIKPDKHEAFYNMGNAYDDKGEYDQAIEAYQQAIAIKPDDHEAFNNMGIAYHHKGEYDQAIEAYQQAIAIKPDYHEAFYNMGSAYDDKGEYDQAIEAYQQAIAIKLDDASAYGNLGWTFLKSGNIAQAEPAIQKAIELGETTYSYMNLGHIYLYQGEVAAAIENYKLSLSHYDNPDDFWGGMEDDLQYLTQYGITEEQYQEVLAQIKKAQS